LLVLGGDAFCRPSKGMTFGLIICTVVMNGVATFLDKRSRRVKRGAASSREQLPRCTK
jgi:hypothetical protein